MAVGHDQTVMRDDEARATATAEVPAILDADDSRPDSFGDRGDDARIGIEWLFGIKLGFTLKGEHHRAPKDE
jgi:hypothetical protein